jgi:hypothetical protein
MLSLLCGGAPLKCSDVHTTSQAGEWEGPAERQCDCFLLLLPLAFCSSFAAAAAAAAVVPVRCG